MCVVNVIVLLLTKGETKKNVNVSCVVPKKGTSIVYNLQWKRLLIQIFAKLLFSVVYVCVW